MQIPTTDTLANDTLVSKIRLQGVTLYRLPSYSAVATIATRSGRGIPDVFVRVRDLYNRFSDKAGWHDVPEGFDYIRLGSILSPDDSVVKLAKTRKKFAKVFTVIFYGAAGNQAGVGEMCKHRTKDCTRFCLISSGKGSTPQVGMVRIARTRLSVVNPDLFWSMWDADFEFYRRRATKEGKRLSVRPNGTTDIMPQRLKDRIAANPDVLFYDYTAVPSRIEYAEATPNYEIVLSRKETKANHLWIQSTPAKYNVAIVTTPALKAELLAENPALFADFDEHDWRVAEADGTHKLGLLAPKGTLRGKETGFVATTREQVYAMAR